MNVGIGVTRIALAIGATSALWGQHCVAQEPSRGEEIAEPQSIGDTPSKDELKRENTVIVTTRRREESAQDIPVAVGALTGVQLEQGQINNVSDLNGRIPGLVVTQAQGGGAAAPTFTIRGQYQQELTALADPSVSLYIDDVPIPRPYGQNMGFFDIGAVEVARGPQGTLFGRNTTGGAILIRTNEPTDKFEGHISQLVGNLDAFTTEAVLNVPLSDQWSLRVAGQYVQRGGYLTDVVTGNEINDIDEKAIRLGLAYTPSDQIKSVFTANYAIANNGGTGGFIENSSSALFTNGLAAQANRDIYHTASGVPMYNDIEIWGIDNTTTIDLNDIWTLKNTIAYRTIDMAWMEDLDGVSDFIFPVQRPFEQKQFSEELQFQADFKNLDLVVGAFYFWEEAKDQALAAGALIGSPQPDPGDIEAPSLLDYAPYYSVTWVEPSNTSYAVFAQGTYHFTDKWSATAGARFNHDRRELNIFNRAYIGALSTTDLSCRFTLDDDGDPTTPEVRPALENCAFSDSASFEEPTYNLSIEYKPTKDLLLYAAHRHGYRSGGYAARGSTNASLADTFDPETVDDVELGVKADWYFGGSFLRTNLALYQAKYKGAQRLLGNPNTQPPTTALVNAGEATIKGTEFEILYRPNKLFEFGGFWAYTDAQFDEFMDLSGNDLSPQTYPHSPENIYNLSARFFFPVDPANGDLSAGVTFMHQDGYDASDNYAPEVTLAGAPNPAGVFINNAEAVAGHELINVDLEWRGIWGSNVDVSAFIKNAADEEYVVPYQTVPGIIETRTPGEPRTYGIKLRYNF